MKMTRSGSRNRAWLCFRPIGMEAELETEDSKTEQPGDGFSSSQRLYGQATSGSESNGSRKVSRSASSLSAIDCSRISDQPDGHRRSKGSLSRILRAVMVEPSSRRRSRVRRVLTKSKSTGYLEAEENLVRAKSIRLDAQETPTIPISPTSSSSSSTQACETNLNLNPRPEPNFSGPNQGKGGRTFPKVMVSISFVLFACLCATIFMGRQCPVYLTVACLLVLPRWSSGGFGRRRSKKPSLDVGGGCHKRSS